METIVLFSQNLKLESLKNRIKEITVEDGVCFLTTHFLFENERDYLKKMFGNCEFKTFADFLTDSEMALCDTQAYTSREMAYTDYLSGLKYKKNEIVANKILSVHHPKYKYSISDDLGIDGQVWKDNGFKYIKAEYYYTEPVSAKYYIKKILFSSKTIDRMYHKIKSNKVQHIPEEVHVGYFEGRKYVFLGKLSRIGYRLDIDFKPSEEECEKLNRGQFETKETCTYMTTWHEHGKCNVPDNQKYDVRWAQDGYLPPNYSHKDYFFKPDNVKYYCWDILGTQLFKNQGLPYEMIPFRKKLYLPESKFPSEVKNVLIVASGSGDWTALKNRSDDDIMVDAFVQMARRFPNIHFTYRCHPTWVHPQNVGVNAINRVHDYFKWLNLPNLTLSSNIPPMFDATGKYKLSFSRTSLEEDLKQADFVIGEHSISMIDAAFKKIPFFSVNITNRRSFFVGITDLGFPCCSTIEEIGNMIKNIDTESFRNMFLKAVDNYNKMTDMEI